jgi:hypothetical protein
MTSGERRFASRLETHLEDDYLCWYDVPVGPAGAHPDFVILHPRRGILILEVKDWRLSGIHAFGKTSVTLITERGLPDLVRVMDLHQEQLARSLGEGHRVIHGVAGSGKTMMILGYRCQYLAKVLPKPILFDFLGQRHARVHVEGPVEVPGYELSDHAIDVLAEREIATTWVVGVLAAPERTERDRSDPDLLHALGRIAERDNRVLRVVYNASMRPPRIVTVYFDRRQRGKI